MTVRATVLAFLGVLASWRLVSGQGGTWVVTPASPTVGDTIWLEREVPAKSGWQIRAGKLAATEAVEPLTDPAVLKSPAGWVVRYAIVAWKPGAQRLALPPLWRLAPDGRSDSLPGGTTGISIATVIPETLKNPDPRGPLAPLRASHQNPVVPLTAVVLTTVLLGMGVALRRRRPGPLSTGPALHVPLEREVPDARWLSAGEPKAVAVRATGRVRTALARAVPEAHPALATAECLAVIQQAGRKVPVQELRDLLEQLDRVAYASAHGTDVTALAAAARRWAKQLVP
ncbi:MAG TPA: hypothetical protein VJN39_09685 [Gemmatimonadales bacterium]|nr:hypothetical protein [Gemmatimonadales bacterium]